MSMHPDLERLGEEYDRLVDAVENGHISETDALATINNLIVTDATGGTWGINAQGQYTKAAYPGGPSEPADPATYRPNATAAGSPFSVPAFGQGAPNPFPSTADIHQAAGPDMNWRDQPADNGWNQPQPDNSWDTGNDDHWDDRNNGPVRSLQAREERNARREAGQHPAGRIQALIHDNKKLLAIAGVGLVVIVILLTRHSSPKTAGTPLPTTNPSSIGSSLPQDGATPTTGATAAGAPTGADSAHVLSVLTSGNRTLIAKLPAAAADPKALTEDSAMFAGLKAAGLSAVGGPIATTDASHASQNWSIHDVAANKDLLTIEVTWVKTAAGWQISALPVL